MASIVVFDRRIKKYVKKRLCNKCGKPIPLHQGRWFNHVQCVPVGVENEFLYPLGPTRLRDKAHLMDQNQTFPNGEE